MKRSMPCLAAGLLSIFIGIEAQAMPPKADRNEIVQDTFETNLGDWLSAGLHAKASLTSVSSNVKNGRSALRFDYLIQKGELDALMLPTPDGELAKMHSLQFWTKVDHATTLALVLHKKNGGRYNAYLPLPPNQWRQVKLSPADFLLAEGAADAADPDQKLDLAAVDYLAVADTGMFFAQSADATTGRLTIPYGTHALYMDDFILSEKPAPADPPAGADLTLESFPRNWMALSDATLSVAPESPLSGQALKWEYRQAEGKIAGLIKYVRRGALTDAREADLTIASQQPITLIVQLEEATLWNQSPATVGADGKTIPGKATSVPGARYQKQIKLPGGQEVTHLKLLFAEFALDPETQDTRDHLDLNLVNRILILDASGLESVGSQVNTVWLNGLSVLK